MLPRRSRAGRATARPDRALQPAEGTFDICHIAMPCTSFCLQAHTRLHLFFHSHLLTVTAHNATRLDGEALNMAGTVRPQCWPRSIMMLLLRTQPSTHLPIRLSSGGGGGGGGRTRGGPFAVSTLRARRIHVSLSLSPKMISCYANVILTTVLVANSLIHAQRVARRHVL